MRGLKIRSWLYGEGVLLHAWKVSEGRKFAYARFGNEVHVVHKSHLSYEQTKPVNRLGKEVLVFCLN